MDNHVDRDSQGCYDFDLDIQLETTIDSYEQDRKEYWTNSSRVDSSAARILWDQAEHFAEAIVKATEELVTRDGVPDKYSEIAEERKSFLDEIRHIVNLPKSMLSVLPAQMAYSLDLAKRPDNSSPQLHLLWEHLVIRLAWDSVSKIRDGAVRALQIWSLLLENEPTPGVVSFLRHVSKCYIAGLNSECVILCRGVLDSAFRDAVSDDACKKKSEPRKHGQNDPGLTKRILVAHEEERIDADAKKFAFDVKESADRAIHSDPAAAGDAFQTIKNTMFVLRQLVT